MNRIKWIAPLLIVCVMLAGCPYGSTVPIDKPSVKINDAVLGKWNSKDTPGDLYVVTKTDDYHYKIVKNNGSGISGSYKAYLSNIDGEYFLNVQDEKNNDSIYYFFKLKVDISRAKVTLEPVTENITEEFSSSEALKEYFKKYKSLSFFYGKDTEEFIKK